MSVNSTACERMNAFIPSSSSKTRVTSSTRSEAGLVGVAGMGLITRANLPSWASRNRCSRAGQYGKNVHVSVSVQLRAHADLRVRTQHAKELASYAENPRAEIKKSRPRW